MLQKQIEGGTPTDLEEIFETAAFIMENTDIAIQWIMDTRVHWPKWKVMNYMTHIHLLYIIKDLHKKISQK